jgi:hypothetical protein
MTFIWSTSIINIYYIVLSDFMRKIQSWRLKNTTLFRSQILTCYVIHIMFKNSNTFTLWSQDPYVYLYLVSQKQPYSPWKNVLYIESASICIFSTYVNVPVVCIHTKHKNIKKQSLQLVMWLFLTLGKNIAFKSIWSVQWLWSVQSIIQWI